MKKRIGIIGFGWIARDVHFPQYEEIKDQCEITAVCDISPEALKNAKEKIGLTDDELFTDYKELIDSGLCDAVDICTPNYLHCEIAKYALNAGIRASIEKPAGINAQEVKELYDLSQEKKSPVFVCFSWHHRPNLRYFKDLIDSDITDGINHIYINCIKDSALWPGRRLEWRFIKEQSGTGVLCDLGSHMIDLLNWMGADVVGLTANYGTFVKERQLIGSDEWGKVTTDDWANIVLDLSNGASATINLSRGCATCGARTEVEIFGNKGRLKFADADHEHILISTKKGEVENRRIPEEYGDPHEMRQCKSFVNLLNGITDQYTSTLEEGLKAQIILDAAEIAGREKRYVTLKEVEEKLI